LGEAPVAAMLFHEATSATPYAIQIVIVTDRVIDDGIPLAFPDMTAQCFIEQLDQVLRLGAVAGRASQQECGHDADKKQQADQENQKVQCHVVTHDSVRLRNLQETAGIPRKK